MNAQRLREALEILGWRTQGNFESRNVLIKCPFAFKLHKRGTDNEPSMAVAPVETGTSPAICNSCGTKGSFVKIVRMALDHGIVTNDKFTRVAALEVGSSAVRENAGVRKTGGTPEWKRALDRTDFSKVPQLVIQRGFKRSTIREWELGYDTDNLRVAFPVYSIDVLDGGKRLVGALSRRTEKSCRVRYPTYKGWDPSLYLYGEHLSLGRSGHPLVVVEGPFDALWVHQSTPFPAVSLLGLHLSVARIQKLRMITEKLAQPVVLMLDNDQAGRDATHRFVEKLRGRFSRGLWLVEYPRGSKAKDPPELKPEELLTVLGKRKWAC